MAAAAPIPAGERVPTADQRVVIYNVPWSSYEAQLALRGEAPVPRMAYLKGVLELMSPSKDHERIKSYLGRLVEAFALENGIDLSPYGAWTLKNAPKESGAEPDECYLLGGNQQRDTPDLVIEVIWTSGGLEKLEIYRRLGVGEVWIWRAGSLKAYVLSGENYEARPTSAALPGLDLTVLASFLDHPTAMQAVRAFREALRQEG
jgi:Uma2 family endonuclease